MRIVIAGAGEVGYNLAKSLSVENDVILIEKRAERRPVLDDLDVKVIIGNAANVSILKLAEAGRADIFVGVTGDDEVNLISCLAAHRMGARKTIARVGNPEYVDKPIIFNHPLGIDVLVCPELVLAHSIVNLVKLPGAIDIEMFAGGTVEMIEGIVGEDSVLKGRKISELSLPSQTIILAVARDGGILIPRGDTVLGENDRVIIIGTPESIEKVQVYLKRTGNVRNVTIIGGGTVGSYIAMLLEKTDLNIKLIENSKERCEELTRILRKVRIIQGDGTDIDLLEEERIGDSDVLIAVTESDEKNLLCSLLGRNLGVEKTISRVEKEDYIRIFQKIGIDVALSPRKATYIEVLKHMRKMKVNAIAEIEHGEANLLEIEIGSGSKLAGKTVENLNMPKESIVSMIIRGERPIIPDGSSVIREGDRLLVFTKPSALKKVEKLFSK